MKKSEAAHSQIRKYYNFGCISIISIRKSKRICEKPEIFRRKDHTDLDKIVSFHVNS